MAHKEQTNINDRDQARRSSHGRARAVRKVGSGASNSGRRKHLRPEPRKQIDASTIGLCYWLIAQRIVREAEEHGDLECPDPEVHAAEAGDES